jgi:undecaprenyl-diphosphatase
MTFWQIITLALVQGITEFLPISSSAHLILVPELTPWPDQGLAFDVALHVGSLIAVLWYFRRDLIPLSTAWYHSFRGVHSTQSRLAWGVGIATIPVGLAGLLLNDVIDSYLRGALVIAATTIFFGLLLGFADIRGTRQRDEYSLSWRDIVLIGCAQALALIPGTSRSGITMTAALLVGLNRKAAARFSFLLSIPVIILAGGLESVKLLQQPQAVDWPALALATGLSAVSAYVCIHVFIRFLEHTGMLPFVIYRLVLGGFLLLWFYV